MKWTDYTTKETLEDNDELMILDADVKANKRTLMSKIWDYVVDKMTTAVIAKLGTTDKTLIGAVNELNSNKQGALKTIAKQYSTNEQGVITTEINRTAVVVSCRSNNAIVDPFVIYGNDYWNAKIQNISGSIPKNTNVYVAFFYFE
jgi:hypothetical protein